MQGGEGDPRRSDAISLDYEADLDTAIQRHHGTIAKHAGDGALATFPSGSEAIAEAVELRQTTRDPGLDGTPAFMSARSNNVTTTLVASPSTSPHVSWAKHHLATSSSPRPSTKRHWAPATSAETSAPPDNGRNPAPSPPEIRRLPSAADLRSARDFSHGR